MALVLSRNVKNIVFKSCTNFLSRIVVHKFENESKEVFPRPEKFTNCLIETNADLKFMKIIDRFDWMVNNRKLTIVSGSQFLEIIKK